MLNVEYIKIQTEHSKIRVCIFQKKNRKNSRNFQRRCRSSGAILIKTFLILMRLLYVRKKNYRVFRTILSKILNVTQKQKNILCRSHTLSLVHSPYLLIMRKKEKNSLI